MNQFFHLTCQVFDKITIKWFNSVKINNDFLDKEQFLVNFLSKDAYKELMTKEFSKYNGFTFFDYECFISNLIVEIYL